MAVEAAGPRFPQHLFHPVQHPLHGLCPVVRPQRAGVQMAKVHAGDKALVQRAQLQHLVQIAQLVDLAHGLRAEGQAAEPGIVAGPDHFPQ